MIRNIVLLTVVMHCFAAGAIAQAPGYAGKKNLAKINVTHFFSNKLTLEYERALGYHFTLLAHGTLWKETKEEEDLIGDLKVNIIGAGLRLYEKTPYPAPKGRFMYFGLETGRGKIAGASEYINSNHVRLMRPYSTEELRVNAAILAFGTQYFIVKELTLEFMLGFKAVSYTWPESDHEVYDAVARFQFELFAPSYYGDLALKQNKYFGFNPLLDVKIGFAF